MGVAARQERRVHPVRVRSIEDQIVVIRGQRVMLDSDLARIYGVSTKRINEQVKRNRGRFPKGFVFQLTLDEARQVVSLRSQIATLKRGKHLKHAPHVFTEHGAIMLASVLNSAVAVQASVFVVQPFVRMRSIIAEYTKSQSAWMRLNSPTIQNSARYSRPFGRLFLYRPKRAGKLVLSGAGNKE